MARLNPLWCVTVLLILSWTASAQVPRIVVNPMGHSAKINNLLFTPDGTKIISISEDKTIRIWNADNGEMYKAERIPYSAESSEANDFDGCVSFRWCVEIVECTCCCYG